MCDLFFFFLLCFACFNLGCSVKHYIPFTRPSFPFFFFASLAVFSIKPLVSTSCRPVGDRESVFFFLNLLLIVNSKLNICYHLDSTFLHCFVKRTRFLLFRLKRKRERKKDTLFLSKIQEIVFLFFFCFWVTLSCSTRVLPFPSFFFVQLRRASLFPFCFDFGCLFLFFLTLFFLSFYIFFFSTFSLLSVACSGFTSVVNGATQP